MRGRLLNLPAIARAIGFAFVAIAIVTATLHSRETPTRREQRSPGPAVSSDPLPEERKRCQVLATQAKDDAAREAAWAESRRRFFTYQPPSNATTPSPAPTKSSER